MTEGDRISFVGIAWTEIKNVICHSGVFAFAGIRCRSLWTPISTTIRGFERKSCCRESTIVVRHNIRSVITTVRVIAVVDLARRLLFNVFLSAVISNDRFENRLRAIVG